MEPFSARPFLRDCRAQNFTRVRELARANRALVNVRPSGRWTALHQTALAGDLDTARFLLARGADPSLLNRNGQTARQVAQTNGMMHFVDWLAERGHGY